MTKYEHRNGKVIVKGKAYDMLCGSRAQVFHGTAYKTSGGLKKEDLVKNKSDRIVSKAKHVTAKKEQRLVAHGYGSKKGHFGPVRLGSTSIQKALEKGGRRSRRHSGSRRHSRKTRKHRRGGALANYSIPLLPGGYPETN
jgi:hypothetical protein